jgi:hypothetical protein
MGYVVGMAGDGINDRYNNLETTTKISFGVICLVNNESNLMSN